MVWEIENRGFLPSVDPCVQLPDKHKDAEHVEEIAQILPSIIESKDTRKGLIGELAGVKNPLDLINAFSPIEVERLMMLYSFFGSSYVHAGYEDSVSFIPKEISLPLVLLADRVGRKPILSYANYCLTNWKKINPNGPISLGNVELMQHFAYDEFQEDESWFILIHTDIEDKASNAISAMMKLQVALAETNFEEVESLLIEIGVSFKSVNETLKRMPEGCRPDVYFERVRPYIFGFDDVVYENCFKNEPMSFRGETGAQSSIIPFAQTILGVKHKQTMLVEHLKIMRQYMPEPHRKLLEDAGNNEFNLWDSLKDKSVYPASHRELYNDFLKEFITFRKQHIQYAVDYIQKKVVNPKGTGGTPYVPWLYQLVEESESFYL